MRACVRVCVCMCVFFFYVYDTVTQYTSPHVFGAYSFLRHDAVKINVVIFSIVMLLLLMQMMVTIIKCSFLILSARCKIRAGVANLRKWLSWFGLALRRYNW